MVVMPEGGAELTGWGSMTRSMVQSTRSLRKSQQAFIRRLIAVRQSSADEVDC